MDRLPTLDEYDRARREQEATMGVDYRLMLDCQKTDGLQRDKLCMADLGRKDYFGDDIKDTEQHEYDAVIKTAHLKMYAHFMLGWKPDTMDIAQEAMLDVEQVCQEFADEFIKLGQRIMLAQILNDSAGYLEVEER